MVVLFNIHCKSLLLDAITLNAGTRMLQSITKTVLNEVDLVCHWEVSGFKQVDFPHADIGRLCCEQVVVTSRLHELL